MYILRVFMLNFPMGWLTTAVFSTQRSRLTTLQCLLRGGICLENLGVISSVCVCRARRNHIGGDRNLPADEYRSCPKNFCFFFCIFYFDNQFRIYKPSDVPDVSLTIRTLDILQDYYFNANFIKIFARLLTIFQPLTPYVKKKKKNPSLQLGA